MQPPDRDHPTGREPVDIADALQRAPLEAPPRSAWPELQAELARREHRHQLKNTRRRRHWMAMAATLLLAAAIPAFWLVQMPTGNPADPLSTTDALPTQPQPVASADLNELALLRRESAELESWLAAARDDTVISATGDGLREALTGRVQYVDALISDPQISPDTQLPLWRERVLLLRRLATIESSEQLLAVNGDAEDSQLVMAF